MNPFQEFRLWARRAPVGERASAGVAAVLFIAVLAWLIVPAGKSSKVSVATGKNAGARQAAAGAPASTVPTATGAGAQPAAGAANGGGGNGGGGDVSGGDTGSAAPAGPSCPSGSTDGVSDSQIKIAVTLVNVVGPAANSIFGIPSPAEQQADFQAVIDSINQEGGIGCRQIAADFHPANPADQNQLQQTCLDIAQSGDFAVVDPGAWAVVGPMCFAQHQLPYFGGYLITQKQGEQGYPYLFDLGQFDRLYRDTALALRDRAFFDQANGFSKLGIIYHDCYPELISQSVDALHQSGVQDPQIVTYDLGCPSAFASPSDIAQAVLKFKGSGVTHMTEVAAVGDLQNFTTVAEQQGFRPKWGLPDDQVIGTAYGSQPPNANNFANAVAITQSRNGEERTDGMAPTPGTAKCDSWYQAHGLPPTYKQPPLAGNACDQLWMLKAAFESSPQVGKDALAAGLQAAGSIDFSYPEGPNTFAGDGVTTGGQFWRVAQFFTDCKCWKVIDPDFHPTYG